MQLPNKGWECLMTSIGNTVSKTQTGRSNHLCNFHPACHLRLPSLGYLSTPQLRPNTQRKTRLGSLRGPVVCGTCEHKTTQKQKKNNMKQQTAQAKSHLGSQQPGVGIKEIGPKLLVAGYRIPSVGQAYRIQNSTCQTNNSAGSSVPLPDLQGGLSA